ncbi:hypothetical protein GCM10011512_05220 [Tersicoccus solisilvae]|uniref:Uncharacterized protein n=1 Tax=Tersicoccus solisilvae TaxID=1882339 RepID=A0ABQ1NNE0_9MICC|nr:hypothetical protein GCM10011512_05220 [Tersicoccus solisilvae]
MDTGSQNGAEDRLVDMRHQDAESYSESKHDKSRLQGRISAHQRPDPDLGVSEAFQQRQPQR